MWKVKKKTNPQNKSFSGAQRTSRKEIITQLFNAARNETRSVVKSVNMKRAIVKVTVRRQFVLVVHIV